MKIDKNYEKKEAALIKKGDKSFIKHETAEINKAKANAKKNIKNGGK